MKYLFVNVGIRQGEYSFNSLSVHEVENSIIPDEFGRKYAQNFYHDDAEKDDSENEEYWHDSLITYLNECKEISLEEYQILSNFL
jgi:hypothetical protein